MTKTSFLRFFLTTAIAISLGSLFALGYFIYSAIQGAEASAEKKFSIGLQEDFKIQLSQPVSDENFRETIVISPKTATLVSWENNYKTLVLSPRSNWKPETNYSVTLPAGKTKYYAQFDSQTVHFSTENYPNIINTQPKNGEKDVIIGVEDPIIVELDKGAEDFWIDFTLIPQGEVIYQNNVNRSRFEILPRKPFEAGTTYELSISAYPANTTDPTQRKILKTINFQTLPPSPSEWSSDHKTRIVQAKKFTRPQINEGKYIDINIDAQVMTLFENGNILDSYIVSSGLPGMDTPKGRFQIHNQHPRPWSRQYELFMPYWMAITPDGKYGIHELPEWPGGYKEGENHLGIPVSHGCVRLGVGPAQRVYEWAEVGIPVIIY
jgi:lipoprotein-anchoring transpeptidase ErfK/SrfK